MPEDTLRIQTMRLDGMVCAIVSGELDSISARELDVLEEMLTERTQGLILDLTGVVYMDSTGLHRILTLHGLGEKCHIPVTIHVRSHSHLLRVMQLIGADTIMHVETEPAEQPSGPNPPTCRR